MENQQLSSQSSFTLPDVFQKAHYLIGPFRTGLKTFT